MLTDFASAALAAAAAAPASFRFGRNKVFIAALDPSKATKALLVEAHRAGLLRLSRADLTCAMDRQVLSDSLTQYMNAEFHLIDLGG